MSGRGCVSCTVRIHDEVEHKGCRGHHHPECREMGWPDGHRRGTVHPGEMAVVHARRGESKSMGDRMAEIFNSKTEEAPVAEADR